jgi:Tol biopolymer transport system component
MDGGWRLTEMATGSSVRLTSGGIINDRPEWSPNGSRVLFRTVRGDRSAIWWQPADGSAPATPLLADDRTDYFEGVLTPDGKSIVCQVDTSQADVRFKSLDGRDVDIPLAVSTEAVESQPRISPDGLWVAYVTTEGGIPQVVVQPLPGPGARVQVSIRGGTEPVWSRDGRRIFYRTEGRFRVAEVSATPTFHVVSTSDFMVDSYLITPAPHANYDVSPDGEKLLVLKGARQQLLVVHDWSAEVRARLKEAGGG